MLKSTACRVPSCRRAAEKTDALAVPMAYLMGMAKEIERKFLVKSDAWLARSEASITIVQCYLAVTAERSIRVRISNGDKARLTLKFGSDLNVRDEFEYDIPLDEAREMQAFSSPSWRRRTGCRTMHCRTGSGPTSPARSAIPTPRWR
jgi:hypothetical protein